ncbi:MAG TPA: Ig-like domain-containing protein [Jatrophihabitans sp.]|nr:Ig-like domain-containing protein [Jatrophihabitans sp.]
MNARRLRRGVLAATAAGFTVLAGAGAAWAYWTATDAAHSGQAASDTLPAGQTPTATMAFPGGVATATITFNRLAMQSGRTVSAFVINRYSSASGGAPAATFTCNPTGSGSTVSCTDSNVPGGTWYYSDTPTVAGSQWLGAESARSGGVATDSTAPTVAYTQTPGPNGNGYNNSAVSVTLTATDNTAGTGVAYITYSVDNAAAVQVNASTATFNVSGDGKHTVTYSATDNAGNTSSPGSQTIMIDSTPPAGPSITSYPNYINRANVAAVSIGGTAEAGSTVTLTLSDGTPAHTISKAATAAGGNWSFASIDASGLADGPVTLNATATDAAGNTGSATQIPITKDTVAPATPSITTPNANSYINATSNGPSYTVSGTKEADSSVVLTVTDQGAAHTITKNIAASSATTWSTAIDTTGLNQGTITYSAVATDAAGNASDAGLTANTKDTVGPTVFVTTVTDPINNSNQTATSASGSVSDANATTVSVVASDGTNQTAAANATVSSGTWSVAGIDVSSLKNGQITYTATATDAAGNTSSASKPATKSSAKKFAVSAAATQTAGQSFAVTVTAQDDTGAAIANYSGGQNLTVTTNAGNSPSGSSPSAMPTSLTFANGVATFTANFVKAESNRTISVTGGGLTGTSNAITVVTGAASRLAWSGVTVSAGTLTSSPPCLFTCTDTALGNFGTFTAKVAVTDSLGNTVSDLGSSTTVSVATPTSGNGSGGAFTAPTSGTAVSLTIPASGTATSTASFTFKTQNQNWSADTFATTNTRGYADANATVTKN